MNKTLIKRALLIVVACLTLSFIIILTKSSQTTLSSIFLFGAIENFFRWWNELDPSTRLFLILISAVVFGILTGLASAGAGGLLLGIYTGFGTFCSFSSMLTSAFTKTKFGQKLREKYGTKYDHYIMLVNWSLNVIAFSSGSISAINSSKAFDMLLSSAVIVLSVPDIITQSNALLKKHQGNSEYIQKYIHSHADDDKNGLAALISSALLITPAAGLKIFQASDETQLEHIVEETGFKLSDPDSYERIKSFYELMDKTKENLKSDDEKPKFDNLLSAYSKIDTSKESYNADLYQSESSFVTNISLTTCERLGEPKKQSGNWDDINTLSQNKYKLYQHVMQSMDNNSSYKNQSIFYDSIPVYMDSKTRTTYALLEMLNGIPKKSININGYKILYSEYNHNLLTLKGNNIFDLINIDPQFLDFLKFNENHSFINQKDLRNKVDNLSNADIKAAAKAEVLSLVFETTLLSDANVTKDTDSIEEKLIEIIKNNQLEDIIKQALSNTNLAFMDYLKSFNYNDYKSKDYVFRQITSESNAVGLSRLSYYLFLEKLFSKIYVNLFDIKAGSSDELLIACNNNIDGFKKIKDFEKSLDCKTMIAIPYHFR